jgi:AraC-like DNA-binding protein
MNGLSDGDYRSSGHREEVHHLLGSEFFSRGNIPLRILRRSPQMPYPLHTHDFMEMVVVTSGSGTHTGTRGDITIGRGAVFVIKGDTVHGYKHLKDLCLINILFDLEKLALPLFDLGQSPGFHSLFTIDPVTRFQDLETSIFTLEEDELNALLDLIDDMERAMDSTDIAPRFMGMTRFMEIIHFVSRAYDHRHREDAGRLPYRLGSALSHIESHITEKICIEELTEIAGMSESSLLRAFRAITGHPPIRYLQVKRVEKACWYLKHSSHSMTEISEMLGYNDSNYFSRQFHQMTDMSPSEYRSRNRRPDVKEPTEPTALNP